MPALPPISGLVLAGGQGARMGHADKGLAPPDGAPVIERVIARFATQVDEVIISANRNLERYARWGHRLVTDSLGAGPLAGLHAGLSVARHDYLASVPCDAPGLPADLVARLWQALSDSGAQVAEATTGGRGHPVFLLVRKSALPGLTAYLAAGGRKAGAWTQPLAVAVPFDDEAAAFANLNTPDEFARYARQPAGGTP
ncbi:MAG: molybdenum cofactor guanylyltransferase [Betaproteobacteria bacterium]|nr:molybdenum cofactor guanylyltransferase [Betaproteobacteria bacterium]